MCIGMKHVTRANRNKYNMAGSVNSISPSSVQISRGAVLISTHRVLSFTRFCLLVYRPSVPGRKRVWGLGFYCRQYSKLTGVEARTAHGHTVL
jgi:hypothetical protein